MKLLGTTEIRARRFQGRTIVVPRGRVGVLDLLAMVAVWGPPGEGADQAHLRAEDDGSGEERVRAIRAGDASLGG